MGNLIVVKSKWVRGARVRVIGNHGGARHGIEHYYPWDTEEVIGILEGDIPLDGSEAASVLTAGYQSTRHNHLILDKQYVSIYDLEVLDDDE